MKKIEREFLETHLPKDHPPAAQIVSEEDRYATWVWACGQSIPAPGPKRRFNRIRSRIELLRARLFGRPIPNRFGFTLKTTCRTCSEVTRQEWWAMVHTLPQLDFLSVRNLLIPYMIVLHPDLEPEDPDRTLFYPVPSGGPFAIAARTYRLHFVGRHRGDYWAVPFNPLALTSDPEEIDRMLEEAI